MTPEDLRQRVLTACAALREKGFTVATDFWGFEVRTYGSLGAAHAQPRQGTAQCCAIGAVIIHEDPQIDDWLDSGTLPQFAARAIGIPLDAMVSFTKGFDNYEADAGTIRDWYDCGQSLRAELIASGQP